MTDEAKLPLTLEQLSKLLGAEVTAVSLPAGSGWEGAAVILRGPAIGSLVEPATEAPAKEPDEERAEIRRSVLAAALAEAERSLAENETLAATHEAPNFAVWAEIDRACVAAIRALAEPPGANEGSTSSSRLVVPTPTVTGIHVDGWFDRAAPAPGKTADDEPTAAFTACRAGHGIECVSGCAPGKTAGEAHTIETAPVEPLSSRAAAAAHMALRDAEIKRLRAELAEARRLTDLARSHTEAWKTEWHAANERAEKAEAALMLVSRRLGEADAIIAGSVKREDVVRWLEGLAAYWETVRRVAEAAKFPVSPPEMLTAFRDGSWLRDLTMDAGAACGHQERCADVEDGNPCSARPAGKGTP